MTVDLALSLWPECRRSLRLGCMTGTERGGGRVQSRRQAALRHRIGAKIARHLRR